MLLSYRYHVAVQNVEGKYPPLGIEVNIITINIDKNAEIQIAFIGLFFGPTTIGKLFILLQLENNTDNPTLTQMFT